MSHDLATVRAAGAEGALGRKGSSTTTVLDALRTAGFLTVLDLEDHVYRVREPQGLDGGGPRLVGLVIVRNHRIRYAELYGQVFAWWGDVENTIAHRQSLEDLLWAVHERRRK